MQVTKLTAGPAARQHHSISRDAEHPRPLSGQQGLCPWRQERSSETQVAFAAALEQTPPDK